MSEGIFVVIGTVLLIGFFGNLLRNRTKIPESLFLLIAGILIGPVFNLLPTYPLLSISGIFTNIALIIVLMEGGMNLDLFGVIKDFNKAMAFMILSISLTVMFIVLWMKYLFGFSWLVSMLIGISMGGTTSITVIHLMQKMKMDESVKDILLLESVFTDVLLITAAIILMELNKYSSLSIQTVASKIFSQISIAFLVGFVSAMLWLYFLSKIARRHSLLYVATLGFLFILFDFVNFVGGNGAIAVLVFSIFAGNVSRLAEEFKHKTVLSDVKESLLQSIKTIEREFTFFITTFFFVYIGMLVEFSLFNYSSIMIIVSILLTLIMARMTAAKIYSYFYKPFEKYIFLVSTTIPKGFSAILISMMGMQSGLFERDIINIVVAIMFLSTMVSVIGTSIHSRYMSSPSSAKKASSK